MIRTMLGAATIHRPSVKAKWEKPMTTFEGQRSYVRGFLSEDGKSVTPLGKGDSSAQDEQTTLSDANAFIAVSEGITSLDAGADVTVVVLERRYI
jgi:molybdopterin biosynthesis enzyme